MSTCLAPEMAGIAADRGPQWICEGGKEARRSLTALLDLEKTTYQTRQEFVGYIGWPLVQPNALPNSSKFCTVPFTRQRPGE
jgi:hypothetical protein